MKRRLTALLCAVAMVLTVLPLPALAAPRSLEASAALGRGLSVTTQNTKGDDGSARQMFLLDYTPGQGIAPMVAYGSYLYGKSDIGYAVQYATERGATVMAAVNADYFNMDTGIPTGMLIQEGRLCVSDGAWNAIAFFADGTAMAGTPRLKMSYTRLQNGYTTEIFALNKVRTGSGIYLYSPDFSTSTRTTAAGAEVVLELREGDCLRLGQPVTATVVDIRRESPNTPIGPNQLVMSLTEANTAGATFGDLAIGEIITISCTTENPRWHDAVWSVGGGNMLALDGVLTSAATAGRDPRTVIGVKQDGSVSVLVCDGRQAGVSDGISLQEAAQILLNRGCVNVINMDGGGSTTLSYRQAGYHEVPVRNTPSEGALRKCANFLLFVNSGNAYGPESTVITYPTSALVLAGASLGLEGRSINDDYYPMRTYYDGFAVLSGGGYTDGAVFIAPEYAGVSLVGTAENGLSDIPASIETVEHPATRHLVRAGTTTPLTTLAAAMDSVTDLDVYLTDGLYPIAAQDAQFTFAVSGGIGSIDERGVFTAGPAPGLTGTITATWREYVITLPVTVGRAPAVLDTFEGGEPYTVAVPEIVSDTAEPIVNTANGKASRSLDPANARYGIGSLYLTYDMRASAEAVQFHAPLGYPLTGGASIVSLLIRGKGDFGIDFVTPGGFERVPVEAAEQWQYVTVPVPAGATAVAGFSASGARSLTGAVHIDQLLAHYGTAGNDTVPPVITDMAFDPETLMLTATISDNYPMPISADMVRLTLDAKPLTTTFNSETGQISALVDTLIPGVHRLTLTVHDYFLNTARQSLDVGEPTGTYFEDMAGHWARDSVEYLRVQGVLLSNAEFGPQEKVYNEMAAAMISRFVGADVSKYADMEMPFADSDRISDWAWDHVKAMYYEGIMVGSIDSQGVRTFSPRVSTSRAQVMTILGRTIPRGYAYPQAGFEDYGDIPLWARDHIDLLHSMGIVNGYGASNKVMPNETITRAEMASLFFKIY